MSRDESRHRLHERGRPPVPPRPTILRPTTVRVRRRRHSDTMDGYDQMIDLPSQGAPAEISSDYRGQESLLTQFQAKVIQDMAGIQYGLNRLAQQVAAVPDQVLEGMVRVEAPEGSSWRSWFTVCTQRPFAPYRQHKPVPPPDANAARLAELEDESNVLNNRNNELQRELDEARRELQTVRRRMAGMEGQLHESQEEVKKLRGKEAMFRTIILDQAGVQEISDNDILQGFLNMRQNVQKISRSSAYAVDTDPLLSATLEAAAPSVKKFYASAAWGMLGVADRRLRLRAKIFNELYAQILNSKCFGLLEVHTSDGDTKGPVEPGLRRFESMLKERGVSDILISDWIISTIKCVEVAGIEEMNSAVAARDIFAILAPLLSTHTRPSEEDALRANILELCKDAFKLRMLMRKSKNRYVVETMDPNGIVLLSACEDKAESVAVEGGNNSEKSDKVAYMLFGALIKQPLAGDQVVKVLEKAQVVLKTK
ncbi:uncharacterized protein C8A04DRAFT_11869 [Dichotomopilus funicola]|uniref:Uncharacterized protein n=1 Tax=Dichotomopilus funicola TaxID=1934379 RepID=A0AAN6V3V6_9PEZI|nr:hypothetical protein C8A04DRAFT_11869 [Dichotomopilus funicola]